MSKPLKVRIIPIATVQSAIASSSAYSPQRQFNTNDHSREEIEVVLPDMTHHAPDAIQPLELLHPWLGLICGSQHIDMDEVHHIRLSNYYCKNLVEAGRAWQLQGRISASTLEDLEDGFPQKTIAGQAISSLFGSSSEYFVRLDTCSLKDATTISKPERICGTEAVTHQSQLWQRIVTSVRGSAGIASLIDAGLDVYIYLFPWRRDVSRDGTEFRVFCPPLGDSVAAISQYHWHRPLKSPPGLDLSRDSELQKVYGAIKRIHSQIVASSSFTEKLRRTGFTFDVLVLGGDAQLLELNPFGAMTGCGSCLFHWINDAAVLYGKESEVEMRLCR